MSMVSVIGSYTEVEPEFFALVFSYVEGVSEGEQPFIYFQT